MENPISSSTDFYNDTFKLSFLFNIRVKYLVSICTL